MKNNKNKIIILFFIAIIIIITIIRIYVSNSYGRFWEYLIFLVIILLIRGFKDDFNR